MCNVLLPPGENPMAVNKYIISIISLKNDTLQYSSLNAIVAHSKNCPFGVDTTTKLKNITSENNGIWWDMF
jgi:hypothetical protein